MTRLGACPAAALAAILAAAGCRPGGEGGRAVRAYDDALIAAFRTGDHAPLAATAGEAEVRRVDALVDLKKAAGLVLESELTSFAVEHEERTGEETIRVRTRERWRYHDRALRPGVAAGPAFVADMVMAYDVARLSGTWKVVKAETVSNEFLEPRGYAIAPGHHGAAEARAP
ncbi:hypothetical protein [Anaeromyxobacter terrae]|uniref:hypothetical protein n=1 Tax=Anaeromyxobacter terrae TaxID=2925406 RepID=UPI001F57D099|nr:hypothetical protein [Anaeromyxobacter sp. SG22]